MKIRQVLLFLLFALCSLWTSLGSQEMTLSNSNRPLAPINLKEAKAPTSTLSRMDRRELVQEFRGLLSLGTRNHSYDEWKGRQMADCYEPERADETWKHKCEIITGQGNGFYYFFDGEPRPAYTLQRLEVFLQTSDEDLLGDLRPTLRQIFGRHELVLKERVGINAVGPIHHWNTGRDIADLYLDAAQSINGTVHFVWTRTPLVNSKQANLKVN